MILPRRFRGFARSALVGLTTGALVGVAMAGHAGEPEPGTAPSMVPGEPASTAMETPASTDTDTGSGDARPSAAGFGESYWGPIPAPTDSTQRAFPASPRPLWEYPLLGPYRVLQFPFRATSAGLGASYVYLEESGFLRRLAELLGPKPIPYGAMVSFKAGGLSGLGGGVTIFHNEFFGPDHRLKIRTTITSTGEKKATLGTIFGLDQPRTVEVGGGYRLRRNSRFFGLGPRSREPDASFFSQEVAWGGAELSQALHGPLRVETGLLYSSVGTRLPHDDHEPALPEVFDGRAEYARPFGYGDRSEGWTWNLGIVRDATTTTRRPESGGIQRLRASYFGANGGEARADYWSYRIDVEQFVGLWFTERALAARGYLNWIDEDAASVPFQRLLTNDEPDLFRGFRDYRWRDRGVIGASFEYRWPIWVDNRVGNSGLDAYLLADVGQVFGEFEEIVGRRLQTSYGAGIRVLGRNDYTGRIEVAWSREEVVFRLASDQIFQYAGGGLFHGRDQSALR